MRKGILFLIGLTVIAGGPVLAAGLEVEAIVERANLAAYYAGQDGISDVKMTITDAQGRSRVREFRILRYNVAEGGEQKFFVYFSRPADVSRMVYMVWKNMGREDDRWLYLPAMDLVRRVAPSDNRSSFTGSHFVYEDVSGRGITADLHELVEETAEFYRIKNTPKDPKAVEFAYYFVWVRKSDFLPYRSEYYNSQDALIRAIEALEIDAIQGRSTVMRSAARDLERGGETVMEFSNVRYDVGLEEEIFQERYLRRPPMEWLR